MAVALTMYQLRGNQENLLKNSFGTDSGSSSKSQKGVYLYDHQWTQLDSLAEETGCARNEILRSILDDFFSQSQEVSELQEKIVIEVLEQIHLEAADQGTVEAVNKVEQVVLK